jgi:hypothetical protein
MDCADLIKSWIIPKTVAKCSCWVISSQQKISLYPRLVNEIVIQFKGTAPSNLIQITNHMNDKPWRVISKYIYFNQSAHSLTIPIVTDVHHILSIGEPICHILPMNPLHTLQSMKGT